MIKLSTALLKCRAVSSATILFCVELERHTPCFARGDRPEAGGSRIGGVGRIRDPRLRLGTAVRNLPAVVPDRPVGRLSVDLVERAHARPKVLDQRPAVGLAVDVDFAEREARFDRLAAGYAETAGAQRGELFGQRQLLAGR